MGALKTLFFGKLFWLTTALLMSAARLVSSVLVGDWWFDVSAVSGGLGAHDGNRMRNSIIMLDIEFCTADDEADPNPRTSTIN